MSALHLSSSIFVKELLSTITQMEHFTETQQPPSIFFKPYKAACTPSKLIRSCMLPIISQNLNWYVWGSYTLFWCCLPCLRFPPHPIKFLNIYCCTPWLLYLVTLWKSSYRIVTPFSSPVVQISHNQHVQNSQTLTVCIFIAIKTLAMLFYWTCTIVAYCHIYCLQMHLFHACLNT